MFMFNFMMCSLSFPPSIQFIRLRSDVLHDESEWFTPGPLGSIISSHQDTAQAWGISSRVHQDDVNRR